MGTEKEGEKREERERKEGGEEGQVSRLKYEINLGEHREEKERKLMDAPFLHHLCDPKLLEDDFISYMITRGFLSVIEEHVISSLGHNEESAILQTITSKIATQVLVTSLTQRKRNFPTSCVYMLVYLSLPSPSTHLRIA